MAKTQLCIRFIILAAFIGCIINEIVLRPDNGLINKAGLIDNNQRFPLDRFLADDDQDIQDINIIIETVSNNHNQLPTLTFSPYAFVAFIYPATAEISSPSKINSSVPINAPGQIDFLTSMDG